MMERPSFEKTHKGNTQSSKNFDVLRRTLTPRSKEDIGPSKDKLTEEEVKELKYAKYKEKEERMNTKYANYNQEMQRMRDTVNRPERQKQIDDDAHSLSTYITSIKKAFQKIRSTLPKEQRSTLKEELQSLIEASEPEQNISQDVLAGRRSFFSSHTRQDRDNAELKYAHEMVNKRLTLINELRRIAMRYIADSSNPPLEMPDPKEYGGRLPRTMTDMSSDSEVIAGRSNPPLEMPDPNKYIKSPQTMISMFPNAKSSRPSQPDITFTPASPPLHSFGSKRTKPPQPHSNSSPSELADTSHHMKLPYSNKSYIPYRKQPSSNSSSLNTSPFNSNSSLSELADTGSHIQSNTTNTNLRSD